MPDYPAQDIAFSASGLTRYFGNKPIVKHCSLQSLEAPLPAYWDSTAPAKQPPFEC